MTESQPFDGTPHVTMMNLFRSLTMRNHLGSKRIVGETPLVVAVLLALANGLSAQEPGPHYWGPGVTVPGAVASRQLLRGGPVPGYYQPVEIIAPAGTAIALPAGGQFDQSQAVPAHAGLLIGPVYRLRVTNIPDNPGLEVFPTVELIDRLYPPPGQERRFAVPIQLSEEDLKLALSGKFVTRVVYLENPQYALPARNTNGQNWFDIGPGRDPVAVADNLGRPVAIVRMGGRLPTDPDGTPGPDFLYGSPPWLKFAPVSVPAQAQPTPAPVPSSEKPS